MTFFLIWASIGSGRLSFGPELENSALPLTGSTNLPLIAPLDLLKSMLLTLPLSTAFTNCEYVRSAFDELLPARLLTMKAAAISARTIHGTQRNDGELPPPPSGSSPAAVPGARRRVRWGIGDVIAAFAVGIVVSVVAGVFVVDPDQPNRPTTLIVLICAQNFAIIAWLAMVARRKGTGSLRSDFGLEIRRPAGAWLSDMPWFFIGIGLQLVALIPIGILETIYGHVAKQDVVKTA